MKLKDRLKIYFFPSLLIVLHKLGFSYENLGKFSFFNKSIMLAQAKTLGNFETEKTDNQQNIFVLTMLPGSTFHLYIEALIALGLKKKGHEITFIIDDNTLPIHELKRRGNEINWDQQAVTDFVFASEFLKRIGLKYISISNFIAESKNLNYSKKYDSILEATLLKQYKVGVISKDLPLLQEKTQLIKESIAISHYIGEKIVKIKPDSVIMSHGIYSTWGPLFQELDVNNIPILIHSRGKKMHSQVFNWNKTGDSWDVSKEWEKVKNKNLTKSQLQEINDNLESRILHKEDVFVYNFGNETSKEETLKKFNLDSAKPIYTLFTNVLWDAASANREIAFKNPVDWVIETIEWFNQHPEKQLIVKIHPAEIVIGTNMPFYDIILQRVNPNKNVILIKPEEKVNSWSIYEITDLGLVHTTTAGMELPLVNKACMVVSKTHYRDKGFTIDINSKDEYFKMLDSFDPLSIDYDKNKIQALKYAYLLFIRYQIPFNMFFEDLSSDIRGFRFTSIKDYFNDNYYNISISRIENKESIFLD
jgi:hypothetical protein